MKRSVNRITLCLILLILLPTLGAAQQVSLTILHTNDTHSHLLPFSYPDVEPAGSDIAALKVRQNIGGIARRATLVKRLRDDLEHRGTTVWLVDAGDFSDGTPFSTEYHGKADADAMNAAGYTFGTLGNHEFNIPLGTLREVIAMFKFPILCANVTENATGKLLVPASEIRSVGPLKISVFGLTTRDGSSYPAAKDQLTIASEIATARRVADTLHRDAGIVILISHAGEQVDEQIAAAVPGIDVIVGGHSHTRLPVGELMWHSDELKPKEVNGTVIVQAHQWGGELGRLDLLFDKDDSGAWHVDRYHARLLPITSDIPEDPTVASVVAHYWKPIAAHYAEIIGQAAADISERGDDLASYNLVADAVREAFGSEIDFENMGGVRAPLIKGNITRADLVDMDPFNNTVMTFKITGRQLKEILARSRPAVSGLRYRMEGGQLAEVTVGGQPVDDNRVYTGTTNSYFAGSAMKGIEVKDTGKLRLDVITDHVRSKGTVRPVYDSRRVIINP